MRVIDGFLSTLQQANATFGHGAPDEGSQFDRSSQLRHLRATVRSAAPASSWTGAAADSYADANDRHASTLANLAELDERLGAEIGRSAAVVAAGRRDLEEVRRVVLDAAATVPDTAAGQRLLWPTISKGASDIRGIIERSHADLSAIGQRIRSLGAEYDELGKPKDGEGAVPMSTGDGDEGKGGKHVPKDTTPRTTLDLDDIERRPPFVPGDTSTYGPPGGIEIGLGTWLPRNDFPGVEPSPPKAPLDYRDIRVLPPFDPTKPDTRGPSGFMELVPGSGAWVPDPHAPGYIPHPPEVPVDMATAQILDPGQLVPPGMIELYPGSRVAIPDPEGGAPR